MGNCVESKKVINEFIIKIHSYIEYINIYYYNYLNSILNKVFYQISYRLIFFLCES